MFEHSEVNKNSQFYTLEALEVHTLINDFTW